MVELLNRTYWNNSISEWLTALAIALSLLIAMRLVKWGPVRYFSKHDRPEGPSFAEEGIEFAYPTRTLYIAGENRAG